MPPEAVVVPPDAVPPEAGACDGGAGVPDVLDNVVVGSAAAMISFGCNCSGVGRVISVSGEPAALPAAETVTVTVIGLGAAFGFAKSTLWFNSAVHWFCSQASIASAPVLSLSL